MFGGATRPNQNPSPGNIPKSSFARGELDDAKFMELVFNIPAQVAGVPGTAEYEIDASAFYVDNAPSVLNSVYFTLEDCFPWTTFQVGLFFRLRRFTRIKFKNVTAAAVVGHLIHSNNPNFLVMQFTP